MLVRSLFALLLVALAAPGCHSGKTPELRVLGARDARDSAASHVFVQVTNPASRPMRLTRLEYRFASVSRGTLVAQGEVPLEREVPAGAAVVVEVPLDLDPGQASEPLTLRGQVTAELDEIVRTFRLAADIQPH
jgi:hypothetical protein